MACDLMHLAAGVEMGGDEFRPTANASVVFRNGSFPPSFPNPAAFETLGAPPTTGSVDRRKSMERPS